MGKLIKFLFQMFVSLLLVFIFTAVLIALDGTTDQGAQAEVGLVVCESPVPSGAVDPVLDRAVKLYKNGVITTVIVASTVSRAVSDEPAAMAKYLEVREIPADAIIQEKVGDTIPAIAKSTVKTMGARQFTTVLIVAHYYSIMGIKLALFHDGLTQIGKAHVGKIDAHDLPQIVGATVGLYQYCTVTYLFPAAEEIRAEVKSSSEQVKIDADKAKQKVDKSLDNLPK